MGDAKAPRSAWKSLAPNITMGVQAGLIFTTMVAAFAGLSAVFGHVNVFSRYGMSLPRAIVFYLLCSVGVGVVGGVLAPLARWTAGVMVIGAVCTGLWGIGALLAMYRGVAATRENEFVILLMTAVGAFFGFAFRNGLRRGAEFNRKLGGGKESDP
jgi:hypothetical protein